MEAEGRSRLGRLTREIVESLGEDIINGRFKPGETLPTEEALTEHFGASRSVTRESVKVLNAKGLVTASPRRGTSVMPTSNWNMFDPDVLGWILKGRFSMPLLIEFTHVRLAIEPRAAALAASSATPAQMEAVRRGYERMVAASKGDDDSLAAETAFHLSILDGSNNRFLVRMKSMVQASLALSARHADRARREAKISLRSYKKVLDAVCAGDPKEAEASSAALLGDILKRLESRKR